MAVKIALVGAGMYGPVQLKAFMQFQAQGKAELAALADINPKALDKYKKQYGVKGYTDWKEMLEKEEIDAVSIATPDHLHSEMSVYAAEMGKHVLVAKPMAVTVEGARKMLEAANKNAILMQVDYHKRFDAYHQKLRNIVQSGKLGEIQYGFTWAEVRITMPRDFLASWAPKSSPAWLVGTHFLDLFVWITGLKAVRTYSTGQKGKLASIGIDTYDSVQNVVEFENGANLTIHSTWIFPEKFEGHMKQGIKIVGTEGVIEVDSQDRGCKACFTDDGMATFNMGFMAEKNAPGGKTIYYGYSIDSIESFVDNVNFIKSGGKLDDLKGLYCPPEQGLELTAIMAAAHKALAERRVVEIKEVM